MQAVMLLADWAEQINGKLYIQGGGWSGIQRRPDGTITFAIAMKILIPWDQANRRHNLDLRLLTEDGIDVEPRPGEPFRFTPNLEVGRPPGLRPGIELDAPLALNLQGMPMEEGRYQFVLFIDNDEVARVAFDVR